MNDRPTPDTDAAWQADKDTVFRVETSRKLERERDEANSELNEKYIEYDQLFEEAEKIRIERDEAREKYDNLATEHMLVVNKLCEERDEVRDALSRIDEIFCDGEDTHDDWMKMGNIAKDYFKGLE